METQRSSEVGIPSARRSHKRVNLQIRIPGLDLSDESDYDEASLRKRSSPVGTISARRKVGGSRFQGFLTIVPVSAGNP